MTIMANENHPWQETISFRGPIKLDRKTSYQTSRSFQDWLLHRRPGTVKAQGELQVEHNADGKPIAAVFLGTVTITALDEQTHLDFLTKWHSIGREGIIYELLKRAAKGDLSEYEYSFPYAKDAPRTCVCLFSVTIVPSQTNQVPELPAETVAATNFVGA